MLISAWFRGQECEEAKTNDVQGQSGQINCTELEVLSQWWCDDQRRNQT